jgi:hypothetical protein
LAPDLCPDKDLAGLIEDADIQASGVQVDSAVVLVLLV